MATPPGSSDDGAQTRFYKFGEVDRPAEPDPDWNLDTAALDAVGIDVLVFEIFIGRNGEVVDCVVLEPVTLPADVRTALEDRLRHTILQPALKNGTAVASFRRIQVSVTPPGQ